MLAFVSVKFQYRIAARDTGAEYVWGEEGSIAGGPGALSPTGYVTITFQGVSGATEYAVYRTHDGSGDYGVGFIGTTTGTTFDDIGIMATGTGQSKKSTRQFIAIKDLFLMMITCGFSQEYHPGTAIVDRCDLLVTNGDLYASLETAFILAWKNYGTVGSPSMGYADYMNQASASSWGAKYRSPLELLGSLCRQFGLIPRHRYNINADRHEIELFTRGQNGETLLTFGSRELESTLTNDSVMKPRSIRAARSFDTEDSFATQSADKNYDLHIDCDLVVQSSPALNDFEKIWIKEMTGALSHFHEAIGVRYFDYVARAWATETAEKTYQAALVHYLWKRLTPQRRLYERRYAGIAATEGSATSHTVAFVSRRTTIHDGIGAKNFYANEVRKNLERDELFIQWIEE
jgi:hypothetical protein